MLGTDKSRGYCLDMIWADFVAGPGGHTVGGAIRQPRESFHQTGLWRSPGREQALYGLLNFVTLLNEAQ